MVDKNKGENKKKRILVCDDEESIRLLINEILSDDYEIVSAVDGREALKLVTKEKFDLLIIDIKMPRMHGIESIERIRGRNTDIPIIVCTAYRRMADDFAIKNSDVASFFTKPIDMDALKTKIFELIGT